MTKNNPNQPLIDALLAPLKESTALYEAVGRFVTAYANAETAVHMVARHLSGLSDQKARVTFSRMGLNEVTERIRGFVRIDNAPPDLAAELECCLTQLKTIAERRHNLVHRTTNFAFGTLYGTNVHTSKSLEKVEFEKFTVSELTDMQSDLKTSI